MAEEKNVPNADAQQVQVQVDQRDMETVYANAFQTNMTPDEVFLSFGINQAFQVFKLDICLEHILFAYDTQSIEVFTRSPDNSGCVIIEGFRLKQNKISKRKSPNQTLCLGMADNRIEISPGEIFAIFLSKCLL